MQKVNPIHLLCLCGFLAVLSQPSVAAEASGETVADNITLGQLEAIQSRNFLLEQQVQTARLTKQLRESETQNLGGQVANPQVQMPFIPGSPVPGAHMSSGQQTESLQVTKRMLEPVRLQEIYGKGAQLRARIFLPQGGVTEVVNGDLLPGSKLRVISISATSVGLSDGSELSF